MCVCVCVCVYQTVWMALSNSVTITDVLTKYQVMETPFNSLQKICPTCKSTAVVFQRIVMTQLSQIGSIQIANELHLD